VSIRDQKNRQSSLVGSRAGSAGVLAGTTQVFTAKERNEQKEKKFWFLCVLCVLLRTSED
jgi:hypothetical protein